MYKGRTGKDVRRLKPASLLQRFSLLSLSAFLAVGLLLGWVITNSLEENFVARSKEVTASFVREEFERLFKGEDFSAPMEGALYAEFLAKSPHLQFNADIKKVKVWNRDMVVVWSDDRRLLGQRFPENRALKVALQGKLAWELKVLDKEENRYERQYSRLLELYVPVRTRADGTVDTVFEIYQDVTPLYADINRQKNILWVTILLGFVGVYLACYGIVWRASRRMDAQTQVIRESEEKYHGLVQSAPDGIIGIGGEGNVVLFNEAAERMFGYAAQEVLGRPLTNLMPEQDRGNHQDGVRRLAETGQFSLKGKVKECEGLHRDGRTFPMELSLSVSGSQGKRMITGILRDVTERKAMQEQAIAAEKQALAATIAGSIGHEINNSITGIMGYSELLMEKPDDPSLAKKCAEMYSAQSQRLQLHAKNLLSLSKPREPEIKPVDIVALLDRVTEMLALSGPLKKFVVHREYKENLPFIRGDEMLLEQVVMNLEINACHAMGDQGALTIRANPVQDGSAVEFAVSDTGHGIPEYQRNQIFLPYFTTKEKGKGTGLGLFISKRIVDQHSGSIETHSVVGRGTTFTVRLPAASGTNSPFLHA
jgi:PAS domain S-box-containing protein